MDRVEPAVDHRDTASIGDHEHSHLDLQGTGQLGSEKSVASQGVDQEAVEEVCNPAACIALVAAVDVEGRRAGLESENSTVALVEVRRVFDKDMPSGCTDHWVRRRPLDCTILFFARAAMFDNLHLSVYHTVDMLDGEEASGKEVCYNFRRCSLVDSEGRLAAIWLGTDLLDMMSLVWQYDESC